jgi:hypothetical protein
MATFMVNLWESVFTPGTTPTLLIATNATFAALQIVLAALLFFSYSIHFVVLSTLSASLWWSINWFAAELQKAEKAEEEAGRLRRRQSGQSIPNLEEEESSDIGEDSMDDETETEVEAVKAGSRRSLRSRGAPSSQDGATASGVEIRGGPEKFKQYFEGEDGSSLASSKDQNASLKPDHRSGSQKSLGEESGSVSTDSEWEKVSNR